MFSIGDGRGGRGCGIWRTLAGRRRCRRRFRVDREENAMARHRGLRIAWSKYSPGVLLRITKQRNEASNRVGMAWSKRFTP